MKEVLSQKQVRYAYVDILESVGKLKQFLKLRDTVPVFDAVRQGHSVGIPALAVDGELILVEDAAHMERLVEQFALAGEVTGSEETV